VSGTEPGMHHRLVSLLLLMAMARSSCGGIVMPYVLPVVLMTSYNETHRGMSISLYIATPLQHCAQANSRSQLLRVSNLTFLSKIVAGATV